MPDIVATAEPEASAPEATSAPETIAPETQAHVDQIKTEAASPDADLEAIWEKHHAPAAPPKEQATEAKPDSGQPATTAPEPAQSSPAIAAPQSWPAEYQAKWNTLTPEVQQYIADRESKVHNWVSQAGQELKTFEPIRQALGAFQGYYPQGQEAQFVASLMQANAALHHDPVNTLKALAEHYRVDLAQLAGQQPPQANDQSSVDDLFRDPRLDKEFKPLVSSLAERLHQSEQRQRQVEAHLTAQQQAEITRRQSEATDIISSFSKGKPDFPALHDDIVKQVQLMDPRIPMEKRLADAYDYARWGNPANRERIQAEERKAEAAKAQKELAQKQAEAKKHQSMNVRTGAVGPTPSKGSRWNDEADLGAMYDRIVSRG